MAQVRQCCFKSGLARSPVRASHTASSPGPFDYEGTVRRVIRAHALDPEESIWSRRDTTKDS